VQRVQRLGPGELRIVQLSEVERGRLHPHYMIEPVWAAQGRIDVPVAVLASTKTWPRASTPSNFGADRGRLG
jgi:hypothetical protein